MKHLSGSGAAEAAVTLPEGTQKATVAAGCFWGVEHVYRKNFGNKGLLDAKVGYIGGDTSHPSYSKVCSGKTGHAEALQIYFDPAQVSYETLIKFFYKIHDPTTLNKQGNDAGTQYRSAIFYHDEEQGAIAKAVTELAGKYWWTNKKISTQIVPAGTWYDAEQYHQKYLINNPNGYECPTHYVRTFPDPPTDA